MTRKTSKILGFKVYIIPLALLLIDWNFSCAYSFYEVDDYGRPSSAFGKCCCTKQSSDDFKIVFTCKNIEESVCPQNSKEYRVSGVDCPSNLLLTKYRKE